MAVRPGFGVEGLDICCEAGPPMCNPFHPLNPVPWFTAGEGGMLELCTGKKGFVLSKLDHPAASKPIGIAMLTSLDPSMLARYSVCKHIGTGTSLSLTSNVSLTPSAKSPNKFLQTRPVTIVSDSKAVEEGVELAAARHLDSIPCPTRGVSYSE